MPHRYPSKISELSDQPFFAILRPTSITIPGDERSRTNPGHGYPESTEHYWKMEVFNDETAWTDEIKRLEASVQKSDYKAVRICPAIIYKTVSLSVSLE